VGPRPCSYVPALADRPEIPFDLRLWETSEDPQPPASVVAPLDPAAHQFDPLLLM
jgi:hypothetical protein